MARLDALAEWVWHGQGSGSAAARALLAPAELLFRAGSALRGALYDRGIAGSEEPPLPAVSVGNVSVGGTGKTPVAAWVAGELRAMGASPAIVLRGYGDDEPRVHQVLNPGVPVIVSPDRVAGMREAARRGADVAVLDDAFQHRRARRTVDLVLVSAERFDARPRLLPAGPYREPLGALRRASAVIVTRKSATAAAAAAVAEALRATVGSAIPVWVASLALDELRAVAGDERRPIGELAGRRVLAIAAVGDPASFFAQLTAAGARVDAAPYRDHHAFTAADVEALARRATSADLVVCTLKDAVKLGARWPRAAPALWYVSQRVALEAEGAALTHLLRGALAARVTSAPPAGFDRLT